MPLGEIGNLPSFGDALRSAPPASGPGSPVRAFGRVPMLLRSGAAGLGPREGRA